MVSRIWLEYDHKEIQNLGVTTYQWGWFWTFVTFQDPIKIVGYGSSVRSMSGLFSLRTQKESRKEETMFLNTPTLRGGRCITFLF